MPEVAAAQKFNCPACGADAQWNAAKQALVCPFCGTVSPMELASDGSVIKEHDLAIALRDLQSVAGGWENERVAVKCQSCQAISLFAPEKVAARCEFCGSPSVVPYTETRSTIHPQSLLPFKLADSAVRDKVRAWYGSHWFAPNKLKSKALTDTLHGVYVPFWTFDAQVHAEWTAEAGHYYYESRTVRDGNGNTRTERVQKTRWEPAAGALDHFFDDELVPATKGVDPALLRQAGTFPTKDLVPYDRGYISGWVVEQYQIDLIAAAQAARTSMEGQMEQFCSREVPGDTQRNLQVAADFSAQTFKHILAPVWLLTYNYGSMGFQVVVNGYTGEIAGKYPVSWIKVALVVVFAIIAVLIVLSLAAARQ